MKKMIAFFLVWCMVVSLGFAAPAARAEKKTESAGEAVSNMVIGWNLGNSFDATGDWILQYSDGKNKDFETAWGNPVTPDTLMARVKALGFNAVRIPITWNHHINSSGKIDKTWLKRIREVVKQALDAGLYCIINVHHDTGADYAWLRASQSNYEEHKLLFASVWRQIANYFKNYSDKLLFEGFNEMIDDNNEWNRPSAEANKYINAYNQLFVDTVRATGSRNASRNLVVTTYACAISDEALKGFKLPEDTVKDHLIAEVHFYTPYEFALSSDTAGVYSSSVEKTVDDAFVRIGKYLGKTPLIVGEFGAMDKGNTQDRTKWYTRVITKAKTIGAVCFIWDGGLESGMGLINRVETKNPYPDILTACIDAAK